MLATLNILMAIGGVGGVVKGIEAVASSLTSIAPAAVSASGAFLTVQKGLDIGGSLNDLRARTGDSVRDLVVMQRAFDTTSLGAGALGDTISRLQRSISGVNEEGKSTTEVFRRLKLTPEGLRVMSSVDQFKALSTAISGISNPSERAAIAMQIFGRSGAQMLQLLGDPTAINDAEKDVGRLAETLERNAAKLDAMGDRLSIAKNRLQEFEIAAAEKLLPVLESIANALNAMNPELAVSGALTFVSVLSTIKAGSIAQNIVEKLDLKVLDWATVQGEPLGQKFAAKFLAPMTGALATALPIGLGIAVAVEVLGGLVSAYRDWKKSIKEDQQNSEAGTNRLIDDSLKIRNDGDRDRVLEKSKAALQELQQKLQVAQNRSIFSFDQSEVDSYIQQIQTIQDRVKDLNGTWAKQMEELNWIVDTMEKDKAAKEWLKTEEANALRGEIAKNIESRRGYQEQLDNAKANLAINQRTLNLAKFLIGTTQEHSVGIKLQLPALLKQYELQKQIAELEGKISEEKMRKQTDDLEARKAALEADWNQSDIEKREKRLTLIREENSLLSNRIQLLLSERNNPATSPERKGQIDEKVDSLNQTMRGNNSTLSAASPMSISDQFLLAATTMQNQIGSLAQQIGQVFSNTGDTMRTSLGGAISDMWAKGTSFGSAMVAVGHQIEMSFINSASNMVADWFMSHVVMANIKRIFHADGIATQAAATSTEVGIHAGGEAAKTSATAGGSIMRKVIHFGETIFHGIQVGIRTAAHIAGEVLKTGATILGFALRVPVYIAETIAGVYKAAVGAMSAMASIPYVGPILAVAAAGTMLAMGFGLVSKIAGHADGGLIVGEGSGTSDSIVRRVSNGEYVIPAARVQEYGIPFFDSIRSGSFSASTGFPSAAASAPVTGSGPVQLTLLMHNDLDIGKQILSSRSGTKAVVRISEMYRTGVGVES